MSAVTKSDLAALLKEIISVKFAHSAEVAIEVRNEIHDVRVGFFRRVRVIVPVLAVTVTTREAVNPVTQQKIERLFDTCRPVGISPRFSYLHRI